MTDTTVPPPADADRPDHGAPRRRGRVEDLRDQVERAQYVVCADEVAARIIDVTRDQSSAQKRAS
jgi:hypothetical protein